LKVAIFLPVPVSRKQQRQIEARRSRPRDDVEIAAGLGSQRGGTAIAPVFTVDSPAVSWHIELLGVT
jgi:hypothetical protein